jgi:hypothetical protein
MKIVHAKDRKWLGGQLRHRKGRIEIKRLLEGEDNSPENYSFSLSREGADFFSPRHRHPWDQFRYCLKGEVPIGPRKTIKAGEVGYFPEGVSYGPQDGEDRSVAILQFGGASGNGFLSADQVNRGYDELGAVGEFDRGVFRRKLGKERKNQDGYEAIWEQITGNKLTYPAPRYQEPVVMNPANFAWRKVVGSPGIERRAIGRFSERETQLDFYRIAAGRGRRLPPEDHLRLIFVVTGAGKCGRHPFRRHSAMELGPGEALRFTPNKNTEILSITLPSVAMLGLKAAS